jgi:histone acetyltransferase (RNA polymerase elongator complex component)/very-short-patch-repair endonuclease
MNEYQNLVIDIIELNSKNQLTLDDFKNIKREFSKKHKLSDIPTNIKLLRVYHQLLKEKKILKNIEIENLFKKRSIRSESGIVAVQVLTKPYHCPGQCIFCPNEKWMPKSYISTEPWAMRAALNQFDPIKQVYNRLLSLTMTGHQTDKIEMIVLWWTWDVYPKEYKIEFIKKLYDACNTFSQLEIDIPDENLNHPKPLFEKEGLNNSLITPSLSKRGLGGDLETQEGLNNDLNTPSLSKSTPELDLETKKGLIYNSNTSSLSKRGQGGDLETQEGLKSTLERDLEKNYKYLSIKWKVWYFDFHENELYIREQKFITNWTLPYHKDAKEKAKILRKNQTQSEEKIRNHFFKNLDTNIYRQKPIDHFIADFYIPSSKLIIEVDWSIHSKSDNIEYDARRDEILNIYWIVVARVQNKDIKNNFDLVKEELIDLIEYTKNIKEQIDKTNTPSLSKRGTGGDLEKQNGLACKINTPSLSKRGQGGDLKNQEEIKTKKKYWYDITNLDQIKYSESIQEAIKINETALNRIIGLTVETRPEFITDKNCKFWRELWVTRLEIWVQSMYDDVLEANKRWHSVQQIRDGIHKLRQYGFKFSIHIMPWLYKSSYDKDLWTFQKIYSDPFLKPDEIKFYPTSVIPNTELYDLYIAWKYQALTTEYIQKLIKQTFQEIIPPYTRIKRLIRDIPATEIAAGSNITNLSQLTHNELQKELRADPQKAQELYARLYWDYKLFDSVEDFIKKASFWTKWRIHYNQEIDSSLCSEWEAEGLEWQIETCIIWQTPDLKNYRNFVTLDTRSREIRNQLRVQSAEWKVEDVVNLVVRKYNSSVWTEYFISFEDLQWYLYWFTRLLLPDQKETIDREWLWKNTALIRELHIYGQLASLKWDVDSNDKKQHKWFWSQLMDLAEQISKKSWYQRLSVISGVWVRWYYQKIWYSLEWTYMVKKVVNH